MTASSAPTQAKPSGRSRKAPATAVGGLFFPQAKSLGIDQSQSSPTRQQKIVYAGTVSRSFAEGSELLARLAEVPVGVKQVERLSRPIGAERVAERDTQVAAYQALPLMQKCTASPAVIASDLAVVMADGGRLQILDRSAAAEPAAAEPAAEIWDEEKASQGYWREDKVALLRTMHSDGSVADPCPDIPPSFLDRAWIGTLVGELSRHVKETPDAAAADATAAADPSAATACA